MLLHAMVNTHVLDAFEQWAPELCICDFTSLQRNVNH